MPHSEIIEKSNKFANNLKIDMFFLCEHLNEDHCNPYLVYKVIAKNDFIIQGKLIGFIDSPEDIDTEMLEYYCDSILSFSRNKNLFYSVENLKVFKLFVDEDTEEDINKDATNKIVPLFKSKIINEKI